MAEEKVGINFEGKDNVTPVAKKVGDSIADTGTKAKVAQAAATQAANGMQISIRGVGKAMQAAVAATGIGAVIQTVTQLMSWIRMLGGVFYDNLEPVRKLVDGVKKSVEGLMKAVAALFGMKWVNQEEIKKGVEEAKKFADEVKSTTKTLQDELDKLTKSDRDLLDKEIGDRLDALREEVTKRGELLDEQEKKGVDVAKERVTNDKRWRDQSLLLTQIYERKVSDLNKKTAEEVAKKAEETRGKKKEELEKTSTDIEKILNEQLDIIDRTTASEIDLTVAQYKKNGQLLRAEIVEISKAAQERIDAAKSGIEQENILNKARVEIEGRLVTARKESDTTLASMQREAKEKSLVLTKDEVDGKIKIFEQWIAERKELTRLDVETQGMEVSEEELKKQAEKFDVLLSLYKKYLTERVELTEEALLEVDVSSRFLEGTFQAVAEALTETFQSAVADVLQLNATIQDALNGLNAEKQAEMDALEVWYQESLDMAGTNAEAITRVEEEKKKKQAEINRRYDTQIAKENQRVNTEALAASSTFIGRVSQIWSNFGKMVINMLIEIIAKLLIVKALQAAVGGPLLGGFNIAKMFGFQTEPGEQRVIPGPVGAPRQIMAHGGEVIGRPQGGGGAQQISFGFESTGDALLDAIGRGLYFRTKRTGLVVDYNAARS